MSRWGYESARLLFLSRSRRRLGPRDVQRMVKVTARQAGITTGVTPHTQRHTFTTRYMERGRTLPELRDTAILNMTVLELV